MLPYDERHDFNNVEQITVEDDEVYGVFGDHTIRRQVQPQASKKCLDQISATGFARGMSGFMSDLKMSRAILAIKFKEPLRD